MRHEIYVDKVSCEIRDGRQSTPWRKRTLENTFYSWLVAPVNGGPVPILYRYYIYAIYILYIHYIYILYIHYI